MSYYPLSLEEQVRHERQKQGEADLDAGIRRKGNGKDPAPQVEEPEEPFPVLDGAAYQGLAGDIVNFILPQSESDPSALLVQFLAAFGATVGREAWYQVEGTRLYPNLFPLVVGDTSKARKGTSWDRVASIFAMVVETARVIRGGLSTGEGLKYQVRDARARPPRRFAGRRVRGDPAEEEDDYDAEKYAGVADKRLLVVEAEFAKVLAVCKRPGNTLSATLREASDTGNLHVVTRHDPIVATGAHISIVGHITAEELRREMSECDMANGFGNRFLLCSARRSKLLPGGGDDLDERALGELACEVAVRVGQAKGVGRMRMTEGAYELWETVYEGLSEPKGEGLVGAMTARAEAHAVRWAVPYALLDGKREIGLAHMEAALALVDKGERSVRHVWPEGGAGRNPLLDDVRMRALRVMLKDAGFAGLTTNAIRNMFQRNLKRGELQGMLAAYVEAGRVEGTQEEHAVGHRTTTWFWRQD